MTTLVYNVNMDEDLYELSRIIAALYNPQCHFHLVELPELERIVAISEFEDLMEKILEENT